MESDKNYFRQVFEAEPYEKRDSGLLTDDELESLYVDAVDGDYREIGFDYE